MSNNNYPSQAYSFEEYLYGYDESPKKDSEDGEVISAAVKEIIKEEKLPCKKKYYGIDCDRICCNKK